MERLLLGYEDVSGWGAMLHRLHLSRHTVQNLGVSGSEGADPIGWEYSEGQLAFTVIGWQERIPTQQVGVNDRWSPECSHCRDTMSV